MKSFQDPRTLVADRRLYAEGKTSIGTICATFGISRSTFYRYIAAAHPFAVPVPAEGEGGA